MYSEREFFGQIPVVFEFLSFEYDIIKYGELNITEYPNFLRIFVI